jgi:prepilin-type N-terminal cleavage/methylation domain-containing protein
MKRNGFSLIEVMAAVVLVGVAVVALISANSVFTQNNSTALDMSTAEFLTEQIRELTTLLPVTDPQGGTEFATPESWPNYDDVEDFNGASFGPPDGPINANKERLTTFASFRQFVTVEKVNPSDFQQAKPDGFTSSFIRVTVKIYHNGQQLSSESWIRAKY